MAFACLSRYAPCDTMSQIPPSSSSHAGNIISMSSTPIFSANFKLIFDAALADYLKQTGEDITKYLFAEKLQTCQSVDDVLELFQDKEKQFKDYRDGNSKLINCLNPVVRVLHALSGVLGEAASLVSTSYCTS